MGYFRGFVHGAFIGTIAGLCVAPQPGKRTREQLQKAANSAKTSVEAAERAIQKLTPVVGGIATRVRREQHDEMDTVTAGFAAEVELPHHDYNGNL